MQPLVLNKDGNLNLINKYVEALEDDDDEDKDEEPACEDFLKIS